MKYKKLIKQIKQYINQDRHIYYEKDGIKYFVGDKVTGKFAYGEKLGETFGIVKFGEFDAYWPNGAHEYAYAYGFYVEVENKYDTSTYSICQINELSKIKS